MSTATELAPLPTGQMLTGKPVSQLQQLTAASDDVPGPQASLDHFEVIHFTDDRLNEVIQKLVDATFVAIVLVATQRDHRQGSILGVGLSTDKQTVYLPIGHRFGEKGTLVSDQWPLLELMQAIDWKRLQLVAFDGSQVLRWLKHFSAKSITIAWDVRRAEHIAGKLHDLAARTDLSEVITMPAEAKIEVAAELAASAGAELLAERARQLAELPQSMVRQLEFDLLPVVAELEDNGYSVDRDFLASNLRQQEKSESRLVRQLDRDLVEVLDLSSAKVLAGIGRGDSPDDRFLHSLVVKLRRVRAYRRLTASLLEAIDIDGRVRVGFDSIGTETGRFTSSSYMQTLPTKDEYRTRQAFTARPTHQLVTADYSQQELRVLAQCSGDQGMIQAIHDGVDLHSVAAKQLFGLSCAVGEVSAKHAAERRQAKAVQLGIIYGQGPKSLSKELGMTRVDAAGLIEAYWKRFPAVKSFMDKTHRLAKQHGWVDDLFGRRRHFPALVALTDQSVGPDKATDPSAVAKALRSAQNFVIQSVAATITKLAMLRCHGYIAGHPGIAMVLTLHDELQFEVPDGQVDQFARDLPGLMCNLDLHTHGFAIPLAVEVKHGPNMGELVPWREATHA